MFKKGKIFICLFVILLINLLTNLPNIKVQAQSTIDKAKINYYDMRTTWNISNNSNEALNDIIIDFTLDNNSINNTYCKELNKTYKLDNNMQQTKVIENKDDNSITYQLHINKLNSRQTIQYYIDRILKVDDIKYNINENDFQNITYNTTDKSNNESNNISNNQDLLKYLNTIQYNYNNNKDELMKISDKLNLDDINNPYLKAKTIFEYVNTTIKYDTNEGNKGLSNVLKTNKGVCEEYAELFTALCRVNGIPSRTVVGYWLNTKNISYNTWYTYDYNAHEWSEIYLPNYGWVLVDCTSNQFDHEKVDYSYFANMPFGNHFIEGYNFLMGNGVYYSNSDLNVIGNIEIDYTKQLKKLSKLN